MWVWVWFLTSLDPCPWQPLRLNRSKHHIEIHHLQPTPPPSKLLFSLFWPVVITVNATYPVFQDRDLSQWQTGLVLLFCITLQLVSSFPCIKPSPECWAHSFSLTCLISSHFHLFVSPLTVAEWSMSLSHLHTPVPLVRANRSYQGTYFPLCGM